MESFIALPFAAPIPWCSWEKLYSLFGKDQLKARNLSRGWGNCVFVSLGYGSTLHCQALPGARLRCCERSNSSRARSNTKMLKDKQGIRGKALPEEETCLEPTRYLPSTCRLSLDCVEETMYAVRMHCHSWICVLFHRGGQYGFYYSELLGATPGSPHLHNGDLDVQSSQYQWHRRDH